MIALQGIERVELLLCLLTSECGRGDMRDIQKDGRASMSELSLLTGKLSDVIDCSIFLLHRRQSFSAGTDDA